MSARRDVAGSRRSCSCAGAGGDRARALDGPALVPEVVLRRAARSSRATCRRSGSSRSSRPRSCSSRSRCCSSSGRARSRRRSTCRAATAWRSRSPAAGRCCCSSGGCSTSPTIHGRRRDVGIQWGIFVALLAAGALIVAGARVRAAHAPEPPNPAAEDVGWVAPPRARARAPARAPPARRDRGHRDAARPARRGRASRASRRRRSGPRALDDERTTRLPDRSDERTTRLFDDPSRAETTRRPRTARGADPPPAPPGGARRRCGRTTPPGRIARDSQVVPRSADDGSVNLSAASIYQIDERGLELRRSYMRMTAAEFELLGGMQAWADRNADAIGKAARRAHLHRRPRRRLPARVRERARASRVDALKKGWGSAQAGHFKDIFARGRQARRLRRQVLRGPARRRRAAQQDQPAAEVVPRHLSRLHRPRPRGDAGRRAGAGARSPRRRFGRKGDGVDHQVLAAAERALSRDLQLRLAGDRRGLLLRHVRVDGREPEDDGRGRPRPRHLRPLRHRAQPRCTRRCRRSAPRPSRSRTCARR